MVQEILPLLHGCSFSALGFLHWGTRLHFPEIRAEMQASQVHAMMMEMMLGFKQNQARDLKRDGEAFMASNGSFVRWYEVRVQYGVLNVFSLMLSMDTIIFAPDPDNVVQLRRAETTELVQARMLEPADICLGERVCAWRLARDV